MALTYINITHDLGTITDHTQTVKLLSQAGIKMSHALPDKIKLLRAQTVLNTN